MLEVDIFSDGACSGNPGPGGFGTLLKYAEHEKELSAFFEYTTNNQMELLGAIAGLEALTKPCKVRLVTDSQYVQRGMTEWIQNWIAKGWKKVKNRELWERLLAASETHEIEWVWVRGHSGHVENERCDVLARAAITNRSPIFEL